MKNYKIRALTVVPLGVAWEKFRVMLAGLYGSGEMLGPYEYGCLLRLTSRREGAFGGLSRLSVALSLSYACIGSTSVPAVPAGTPRKNAKAFSSSREKAATVWFDRKQPSCLNFDDDRKCHPPVLTACAHSS